MITRVQSDWIVVSFYLPQYETMTSKAVFLDKDGTLIEDIPYNVNPERIRLTAGVLDALCLLQERGYQLIVVTNQSGISRGYFGETELKPVEERLRELLFASGISLTGFYYCPHHPNGAIEKYAVECSCRKPQPGLLYQAAREHHIDLGLSWLVGDTLHDVEAGNRAGCRTIWIQNGVQSQGELAAIQRPRFIVNNLKEAASIIANGYPEWNVEL